MGLTRVNLLAGLVGAYHINHLELEAPLGLPSGDEFDRTLIVFDRSFRIDGSIYIQEIIPPYTPIGNQNILVILS